MPKEDRSDSCNMSAADTACESVCVNVEAAAYDLSADFAEAFYSGFADSTDMFGVGVHDVATSVAVYCTPCECGGERACGSACEGGAAHDSKGVTVREGTDGCSRLLDSVPLCGWYSWP